MRKITQSASKIVLLYIVMILGLLAAFAGVWSVVTGQFGDAAKIILATFVSAINFVLGFYFGYKGDSTPNPDPTKPQQDAAGAYGNK